ncbi:ABC transporter substrate-binding protein [Streptomyces chartreusis]
MTGSSTPNSARTMGGRTLAVVSCLGLGLSLTACTGNSPEATTKSTFTFALPSAPISLDMAKDFSSPAEQIVPLVTEPLERLSSTGKLTPAIATSVTEPNPTTIVYTIRNGVKFSDGTLLTAQDVAWSIKHVATAPQTASGLTSFDSVKATGPRHVTVKLAHADPTARGKLALDTYVQKAEFAQAHAEILGTKDALPIGSGPYKYGSYTSDAVTLKSNKYYRGPKAPARNITFSFINKDSSARRAMRANSIDGALVSDLKTASQWKSMGAKLYASDTLQSQYLALNTSAPPFDDVHVRKAIAYSIDRPEIINSAYGGYGIPLRGLVVPPVVAGVAPSALDAIKFYARLPQYEFDASKAATELAKSSRPNGFTVTVSYPTSFSWSELTLLNLQQNMKKLGVIINLKPVTQNQWLTSLYEQKNTGIQVGHIGAQVPDPNGLLSGMVGEKNMAPQHFNTTRWTTPDIEKALPVMERSSNSAERWTAAKTVLSQVANDVPYIPLFSPQNVIALSKDYTFKKDVDSFDMINGSWIYQLKASS